MNAPRISLEQWRTLATVVDAGGYAQAAEKLFKSQSSVTYAVQKIEAQLGVKLFEIQGRRAVLTPTGDLMVRRARGLIDEAANLEQAAACLSEGWEAEIRIAVEVIFPMHVLLAGLSAFSGDSPHTRIEVIESVLGGAGEALLKGEADVAITPHVPPGLFGDPIAQIRMLLVAAADHPLHLLGRAARESDLNKHRHIVVRDSGTRRDRFQLSLDSRQRWTFGHMESSVHSIMSGYGFSWLPEDRIRKELDAGSLKVIDMDGAEHKFSTHYLVLADREYAGPGLLRLVENIRTAVREHCVQPWESS